MLNVDYVVDGQRPWHKGPATAEYQTHVFGDLILVLLLE
jgi:hypothetical protein